MIGDDEIECLNSRCDEVDERLLEHDERIDRICERIDAMEGKSVDHGIGQVHESYNVGDVVECINGIYARINVGSQHVVDAVCPTDTSGGCYIGFNGTGAIYTSKNFKLVRRASPPNPCCEPKSNESPNYNGVHSVGLTEAENKVLDHLSDAWNAWLQLPDRIQESETAIRRAVDVINSEVAFRVARRVNPEVWGK